MNSLENSLQERLENLIREPVENLIRESKEQKGIGSRRILVIEKEQQNGFGWMNILPSRALGSSWQVTVVMGFMC
jgi:hypothetical protein